MIFSSALLLVSLASAGTSLTDLKFEKTAGAKQYTITDSSVERKLRLTLPADYGKQRGYPLVVLLHGFMGNGGAIELYSGFRRIAERERFILVSPDGTGNPTGWNTDFLNLGKFGVNDVDYLTRLLDALVDQLKVDQKRIYFAGHSNGAMMANVIGSRLSKRVAGIAAVAGVIGVGQPGRERTIPMPEEKLSVFHIHGTDDRVVAFDRNTNGLLKGVSAPDAVAWWAKAVGIQSEPKVSEADGVKWTVYRGGRQEVRLAALAGAGHDWPNKSNSKFDASEEIWKFFKANSK